jgi:hypothetical protein
MCWALFGEVQAWITAVTVSISTSKGRSFRIVAQGNDLLGYFLSNALDTDERVAAIEFADATSGL